MSKRVLPLKLHFSKYQHVNYCWKTDLQPVWPAELHMIKLSLKFGIIGLTTMSKRVLPFKLHFYKYQHVNNGRHFNAMTVMLKN